MINKQTNKQTKKTIYWIVAKTKKYVSYMYVVLIRQEAAKKYQNVSIETKIKHPRQKDVVFG
jgi:hypothetical protein